MAKYLSYISPKLEARSRPEKGGHAVFASYPVDAGELLIVWGGRVVNLEQLEEYPAEVQQHSVQVEEELYMVTDGPQEPADFVNHSCEPNAGLQGQIVLVALRDIEPDEEICFDYAMSDGSAYDEFACACGTPSCRKLINGNDWAMPELWEKYAGYFSPYLQRRIDRVKAQGMVESHER